MRFIARLATSLLVCCWISTAWAHASLVSVEPGDGSLLATSPKTVELVFNENVTPVTVKLIDSRGRTRGDAAVMVVDKTIVIAMPPNLPNGTQVVSYRVISADGHPVGGSILFSIGAVTSGVSAHIAANSNVMPIWLARIGVYLGLLAGVGGVFFGEWISRSHAGSTAVGVCLILGLVSSLASWGWQGLDMLDLTVGNILTPAPWKATLSSSLGPSLLIAIAAMAASLVAQRRAPAGGIARGVSALALTGVGASLAISGHAATAQPSWLSQPAIFVHGMAVAYWAGALMPLVAMARSRPENLLPVVNRFSRLAMPVVGLLVLTGLTLSVLQLGSFHALIDTRYGLILSTKLMLVMVLLGCAALNRFWLTPAMAIHPQHTRPLLRSLLLECLVALAILAVVAGWRFTPPPRALAATTRPPLALHIHTDRAMFQVLVSPGYTGVDTFVLQLFTGEGVPLEAKEATLALSMPQRGIEPLERKAALGADGYWHVEGVPLPYAGHWHIRVEALVSDFQEIALEDDLVVPEH